MDIDKMVNHKIAKLSGIIKRQIYAEFNLQMQQNSD